MPEVGSEINTTGGEEFEEMRAQDVGRFICVDIESPGIMEKVTVNQKLFTGQWRDMWVA